MFCNLKEYIFSGAALRVDDSGRPSDRELQVATIALLAEMAHSDKGVGPQELDAIFAAAAKAFGVEGEEAGELVEIADFLRAEKKCLDDFVAAINKNFNQSQKEQLLGLVWKVLSADKKFEKVETVFAAELRKRLGLTLEQAVRARQLAEIFEPASADSSVKPEEEE